MTEYETTGDVVVRALIEHGVDTVFGIPGAHTYDLIDAFARAKEQIRFIQTRHEQGAAYMAYGYAQSTGRLGVFTVVPGPGLLNAGAALSTALGSNSPVLCLTGNVMADFIGRGRGQLHELPDQLALSRGIAKAAARIDAPHLAGSVMSEVLGAVLSGRRGPAIVEAPWDVYGKSAPVGPVPPAATLPAPAVDPRAVAAAAEIIASAKRPLIIVGGGAQHAGAEIAALAERLDAPVTAHRSGKGVLSDDHPNWLSSVAAYEYWKDTDVVIGIGSRLELAYLRWRWIPKGLKVVRIDIDPTEFVRLKPDAGILADAADGTRALTAAVAAAPEPERQSLLFPALRARARDRISVVQPQVDHLGIIREVLPQDGFFVEEVSQVGFTARFAFPVYGPHQYVTCGYQDNLGFGYNTALGVKVANPSKAVVSISGDGGFLYGVQEFATAVQQGIGVIAVVFNNNGFGNVRRDQTNIYEGRVLGADLVNPDLVGLAQSFGATGVRVSDQEQFRAALTAAIEADVPALIEVPVPTGSEGSPWPFVSPAPHSGD